MSGATTDSSIVEQPPRIERAYRFIRGLRSQFRGVFDGFEQARAAASGSKPLGYNTPEAAPMYVGSIGHLYESDYAVLFWLSQIWSPGDVVLDLGGNIGLSFYSYQKYVRYPPGMSWIVSDLPEVNKLGRELAAGRFKEISRALSFVEDPSEAKPCNILLASGSIQYIDEPLDRIIQKLGARPTHIVINRSPVYNGPSFVTLQDIGPVRCPYRVFNRGPLLDSLGALGYDLLDSWPVNELSCYIPFHVEKTVHYYSGFYLRHGTAGAKTSPT